MQDVSNIIKLFADDIPCGTPSPSTSKQEDLRRISTACTVFSLPDTQRNSDSGSPLISVSTVPQSHQERQTMIELEKRLYCYPAVAQATAFRYESGEGCIRFGAAVGLFDWIEKVTVADIKQWILTHLDAAAAPVEIVQIDSVLFAEKLSE